MEQLHNGMTLELCPGAFPLSTDSMLLSGFVKLHRNERILDLGSGCGTLGLLLCAGDPHCHVTGIEIDETAHSTALKNIFQNQLSSRMESICADIRRIAETVPAGHFSCCISNPPYFSAGPASHSHPTARREDLCSMKQLFEAAAWALKYGGDFYLVHRPERLAELFCCACNARLEPKKLCLVRHDPAAAVNLVLVQCRKGAQPGLQWSELSLFDSQGTPTPEYRKIYHL